jgi:4-hydroxy-3-methylbut-2-enyl diphosphate reductase
LNGRAHDTICRQVSNCNQELRQFAQRSDHLVFVAGTESSNGRLPYQACKEMTPRTHFVSRVGQLWKASPLTVAPGKALPCNIVGA